MGQHTNKSKNKKISQREARRRAEGSLTARERKAKQQAAKAIMRHAKKITEAERLGRPVTLNEAIASKIVEYVLEGAYKTVACRAVGITDTTLRNWAARAKEWEGMAADGIAIPDDERIFVDFFRALELAEAQAELRLLKQACSGVPGAWQAAMAILERKHPQRWAKANEKKSAPPDSDPTREINSTEKPDTYMFEQNDPARRTQVAEILSTSGALQDEPGREKLPRP